MTEETKRVTLDLTAEEIVGLVHAISVSGHVLSQFLEDYEKSSDPLASLYIQRAASQREALLRLLSKLQLSMLERPDSSRLQ